MKGFLSEERPIRTLREVLQRLRESYCGKIGYEVCRCMPALLLNTIYFLPITMQICAIGMAEAEAVLCVCSTCTSLTGSAATGSESALRLLRR